MMQVGDRYWAMALSGAVLVHAGIVAAILWQPPQSGAVSAGMGGVEVSLGPAGGAPGGEARPVNEVEEAETAEVPKTVPTETLPESAPPEPAEPVEAARPVEVAQTAPAEEAVEVIEEPPVEEAQANVPEPLPEPAPRTAEAAEQVARIEPSTAGTGGKAGTQASPEAGSADAASGGGMPGVADYIAAVRAWLEKYKVYPEAARRRRAEGTSLVRFSIDRDGRVIDVELMKRTGHSELDEATETMVWKANPFPVIPKEMGQRKLTLTIPVHFNLE